MPNQPKRELIDVDVTDLSIVDHGANQKKFNLIKREPPKDDITLEAPVKDTPKVEKQDAVPSGEMPTHEALVAEKMNALKAAVPTLTAALDSKDFKMVSACLYKMRELMWAVGDMIAEMSPPEVMKSLSGDLKGAVCEGLDSICKIVEKGGTTMTEAEQKAAELKKREDQQKAAEEAVTKALPDLSPEGKTTVLDAIKKALGVAPAPAPAPVQPAPATPAAPGELAKALSGLAKRLDDLEKGGVATKTPPGDGAPAPVKKSIWDGSPLAALDKK